MYLKENPSVHSSFQAFCTTEGLNGLRWTPLWQHQSPEYRARYRQGGSWVLHWIVYKFLKVKQRKKNCRNKVKVLKFTPPVCHTVTHRRLSQNTHLTGSTFGKRQFIFSHRPSHSSFSPTAHRLEAECEGVGGGRVRRRWHSGWGGGAEGGSCCWIFCVGAYVWLYFEAFPHRGW